MDAKSHLCEVIPGLPKHIFQLHAWPHITMIAEKMINTYKLPNDFEATLDLMFNLCSQLSLEGNNVSHSSQQDLKWQ